VSNRIKGMMGNKTGSESHPMPACSFDDAMTRSLAIFDSELVKQGITDKATVIQWSVDRFELGGKHNVPEYDTGLTVVDSRTGESSPYVLRTGTMLKMDREVAGRLKMLAVLGGEVETANFLETIEKYGHYVIWRMYNCPTENQLVTFGMMVSVPDDAKEGVNEGQFTGTPIAMNVEPLLIMMAMGFVSNYGKIGL